MGFLRLLLAVCVIASHSNGILGLHLIGGELAVQSFFIISGFYMTMILNEKYNSYNLFISSRFIRIYPLYIITLLFSFIIGLIFLKSNIKPEGLLNYYNTYVNSLSISTILILAITNIFIFFQDIIMFLGINHLNGNVFFTANFQNSNPPLYLFLLIPQAWSISIEMFFYLLAPFIVKRKLIVILLLISISLFIRLYLASAYNLVNDPWSYRFFPSEIVFFLLGTLCYKIYISNWLTKITNKQIYMGCLLLILITVLYNPLNRFLFNVNFPYVIYIVLIFFLIPLLFKLTKNWKFDKLIGELSYPVYLIHYLVIIIFTVIYAKYQIPLNFGLVITLSSIIISFILNITFTKKIEDYRQRRIKSKLNNGHI